MVRGGFLKNQKCAAIGLMLTGFLLFSATGVWCAESNIALNYPTKPIDIIIPYPPGSSIDMAHRVLAEALAREFKQSVNVINKPGGNAIPGVKFVLDSVPDGYTILGDSPGSSSLQTVVPNLPYKLEDRTFIALGSKGVMTYYVNSKSRWKTLKEAVDTARKEPKSFTWAGLSGTTVTDVSFVQFFQAINLDSRKTSRVNFPASGQAVQAVAGGHVQVGGGGVNAILPYVASGNVRVLAVTGEKRHKELPDVPTTAEAGFPSLNTTFWVGLTGPPKLPKAVVDQLTAAMSKVVKDPQVIAKIETQGALASFLGGDDFKKFVMKEVDVAKLLVPKSK
ncbi:MAG: tripartite tricarboxylate transporter substrate binding protein [Dehalococcoidia bacterium]|nr:tripartite tricarboxylate transporter substrate binding protein [Dehalococcoidia bacterium]